MKIVVVDKTEQEYKRANSMKKGHRLKWITANKGARADVSLINTTSETRFGYKLDQALEVRICDYIHLGNLYNLAHIWESINISCNKGLEGRTGNCRSGERAGCTCVTVPGTRQSPSAVPDAQWLTEPQACGRQKASLSKKATENEVNATMPRLLLISANSLTIILSSLI